MTVCKTEYTMHMMILDEHFHLLPDTEPDGVLDGGFSDGALQAAPQAYGEVNWEHLGLSELAGANGVFCITLRAEGEFGEISHKKGDLKLAINGFPRVLIIGSGCGLFRVPVGDATLQIVVVDSRPRLCTIVEAEVSVT